MAPLVLPLPILSLLQALTCPQGAPHSALICSLSGGALVATDSQATEPPFPKASLEDDDDNQARGRCYAALAVGCWDGQEGNGARGQVVMLDTELGRLALSQLGGFLLVLVANEVAPWKVLDKKIRAAVDQLREPLEKVAA
ncbi:hypothetical protein JCM11641_000533 [Rhodosporidiobolus odoratus]